jgi:hypothetical protein
MFRIETGRTQKYCDGFSRRSFLQVGVAGMSTAGLPQILKAKEQSAQSGIPSKDTSVILVWLDGGPGHMDMYDLKPEAPSEYRGIWRSIRTNVPGIEISELFPRQAKIADKFSIVRSLHHENGDHYAAAHLMLTGRVESVNGAMQDGKAPCLASIATKVLGARRPGMPPNVAIPYAMSVGLRPGYFGANYLGVHYDPFETQNDPSTPGFQVANMNLPGSLTLKRLEDRRSLTRHFDTLRREADTSGTIAAMDDFDRKAFDLVTGPRARRAFDIDSEDPRLRDRYGRDTWGQSALLARRLVEAGSTFVTCHFGGWDHHWDLKKGMEAHLPHIDAVLSALFTDLETRGLLEKVLVVVCGEFSRTPRMNDGGNGGAPMSMGTPGRDHWGNAMFCLLGGGGVKGGQVIGATDKLGENPVDRPLLPGDIHHTIYHVLGVDPATHFLNRAGRPVAAIDHGAVIAGLV